jgi:hypothetical protein
VLQVEGVRSVEIGIAGNAIAVLVPHRADVVGRLEAERVRMLTQAVQVGVRGQACPEAEVLRLEDERGSRGVKEDLTSSSAGDFE